MRLLSAGLSAILLALTGCAATPIDPPQTSVTAVRAIIAANIPPMKVGPFVAAKSDRVNDREIRLRAAGIKPPNGSTFSSYMGELITDQLRIVGKHDPRSSLELSGTMVENRANPAIGQASGTLAFEFLLTRRGELVFRKILRADQRWDSSLIGALAIPEAELQYTALYPKLIENLMQDPEFQGAIK